MAKLVSLTRNGQHCYFLLKNDFFTKSVRKYPSKYLKNQFINLKQRCYSTSVSEQKDGVLVSPYGYQPEDLPTTTFPQYLWRDIQKWATKPMITCGVTGRSYKYGEARFICQKFGGALRTELALHKGDIIGILMPNIPEFVIALLGSIEAGVTVTFANPLYTAEEIKRQFQSAGVKCIVTVPQLFPIVQAVGKTHEDFKGVIVAGATDEILAHDKVFDFKTFIVNASPPSMMPELNTSDLAILPYSSGTTGLPKGVMLSHRNLIASVESTNHEHMSNFKEPTATHQDIALSVLPFFHIYGFNGIISPSALHGSHIVSLPRFTPEAYLEVLIKYKPNILFVVPSLLLFLASHPAVHKDHLTSITEVISGAAPASKSLIDKFLQKVGRDNIQIRQGYGMTESAPTSLICPVDMSPSKTGTVGKLTRNTLAKVINIETGEVCGPHQSGELLIKGPQVMIGYWNNEKETKETVDEDGWLHTGDVAYYDDEEYFHIVDRTKELIKVKGNQVSPTELENVILQLPGVADVAVIGVPDTLAGELPKAFVVLRPDVKLTEKQIFDHVEPKVAPFKKLAGGVEFISAIPRNPSGKILRQQLKVLGSREKELD